MVVTTVVTVVCGAADDEVVALDVLDDGSGVTLVLGSASAPVVVVPCPLTADEQPATTPRHRTALTTTALKPKCLMTASGMTSRTDSERTGRDNFQNISPVESHVDIREALDLPL